MSILTSKRFQKYFVPGIVFQSCVIAGGYGTGRELVEYFMGYGPKGGLLGMCIVSLLVWSLICAISFMFFAQICAKNMKDIAQYKGPHQQRYDTHAEQATHFFGPYPIKYSTSSRPVPVAAGDCARLKYNAGNKILLKPFRC